VLNNLCVIRFENHSFAAFSFIPASYAITIVKEREISAKHQQLISGTSGHVCPPCGSGSCVYRFATAAGVSIPSYWLSTYAWDAASYIVPCTLSIVMCSAFGMTDFVSTSRHRLAALVLLFWFYGLSVAPFTYVVCYLFKSHSTAQVSCRGKIWSAGHMQLLLQNTVLFIGIFSMILLIASLIMSQVSSTCQADTVLRYFYRLIPGYDLGNGLMTL
jgi:ATP-binding cassette subfamily A (ABC1) protein 3